MRRLSFATVLELTKAYPPSALLVDVRDPGECAGGMIPGAINIPLSAVSSAVQKTSEEFQRTYGVGKPKYEDNIVVYCLRGGRAERGANALVEAGYKNVDVYPGSWLDWSANVKS